MTDFIDEQTIADRAEFFAVIDRQQREKEIRLRDYGAFLYEEFQRAIQGKVVASKPLPVSRIVDEFLETYEGRTISGAIMLSKYYTGKRIVDDKGNVVSEGELIKQMFTFIFGGARFTTTTKTQLLDLLRTVDN